MVASRITPDNSDLKQASGQGGCNGSSVAFQSGSLSLAMVGPLLPFRGGIAQHTTRLHRALSCLGPVRTASFSRMYPAWLFPGESDRDTDYDGHAEADVDYSIDSLKPWTWLFAAKRLLREPQQALILPWWTVYWAPCFGFLAWYARFRGVRVVFFCHNVVDHEGAWWKRLLTRWVLSLGTAFVTQTRADSAHLQELLGSVVVHTCPHPIYDHYPQPRGLMPKRAALELLFYGFVRPYKGLDLLLEALALLDNRVDYKLTVAGEFWGGTVEICGQIEQLGLGERVELIPRYISERESAELFARADVVVLPYRNATGSGIVPMAYHYLKPVLATRVGGLPDVIEHGRTGWLVPSDDAAALADAIAGLNRHQTLQMQPELRRKCAGMTWNALAETVRNAAR